MRPQLLKDIDPRKCRILNKTARSHLVQARASVHHKIDFLSKNLFLTSPLIIPIQIHMMSLFLFNT
jgi:hypothetical protein